MANHERSSIVAMKLAGGAIFFAVLSAAGLVGFAETINHADALDSRAFAFYLGVTGTVAIAAGFLGASSASLAAYKAGASNVHPVYGRLR